MTLSATAVVSTCVCVYVESLKMSDATFCMQRADEREGVVESQRTRQTPAGTCRRRTARRTGVGRLVVDASLADTVTRISVSMSSPTSRA